ncbi:related to Pseudomonas L-fucose dehydrogenase [Cephalotrichum gorgonifer]|uniref:Related to Pseudomonas L-fucose dehydrogenase n=1 Tax=Cephalotrichum gorgonifer TaxID=2041049 RepID=A0AAE8SYA8_9PEZI|nr:related to Pseudomonas L-fucose dehydrogenase [Cephalotrichum gorgonifer]
MPSPAPAPAAPPPAAVPIPLSSVIPPLILGTATFNTQYVASPEHMPYTPIISRALSLGIRAFDTSPYYGPSESLLGAALTSLSPPRDSYFLITKAGRRGPSDFDYSPAGIRSSVERSLARLGTDRLDLVYCHDVEFVSPADVLAAVSELRRLRSEGKVRYVGISGYPLPTLTSLSLSVLEATGEPLDAVLSYSHFTLQNTSLSSPAVLSAFAAARVNVLLNASILGMGLLTSRGIDAAPMAAWHPAPPALRSRCTELKTIAEAEGMGLEEVAIRWSLAGWATAAAAFGSASGGRNARTGVSVTGVSSVAELEETWRVWSEVVSELEGGTPGAASKTDLVRRLAEERIWPALGEWKDYTWESPGPDYVPTGPSRPRL